MRFIPNLMATVDNWDTRELLADTNFESIENIFNQMKYAAQLFYEIEMKHSRDSRESTQNRDTIKYHCD